MSRKKTGTTEVWPTFLTQDVFTCLPYAIHCALLNCFSLQVMFSGECCCVWLTSLMEDLGMFLLVLLRDQGNAGQYKQWNIPGGLTANLFHTFPLICSTFYFLCKKKVDYYNNIIFKGLRILGSDMTYLSESGLTGSNTDAVWFLQKAANFSIIFSCNLSVPPPAKQRFSS